MITAASNFLGWPTNAPLALKFFRVRFKFNAATSHHQKRVRQGRQTQVQKEGLGSGSFITFLNSLVNFHREKERGGSVSTNL